jgi:hypothetical protein
MEDKTTYIETKPTEPLDMDLWCKRIEVSLSRIEDYLRRIAASMRS